MFLIRTIAIAQPMRRDEAVGAMKEMTADMAKDLGMPQSRILTGSIGPSDSEVVMEVEYESLAKFEESLAKANSWDGMKRHGPKLIELFVPGGNRWEVYRIQ